MKAILTHYVGPSNTRGSHIVADDGDGNRITLSANSSASNVDNHALAAVALCTRLDWHGRLQRGTWKHYCVFVFEQSAPGKTVCGHNAVINV